MAKLCLVRAIRAIVTASILAAAVLPARADVAPRDHLHDLASTLIVSQPPHVAVADDHPLMRRAAGAARDLRLATDALLTEKILAEKDREAWERDAFAWSFFEAGWFTDPKGSNDLGGACGIGQVHLGIVMATMPEALGPDARKDACQTARKDRVYGYRTMLRVLLHLEKKCGSRRKALAAYSTDGACKTWEPQVVKIRCEHVVPFGGC